MEVSLTPDQMLGDAMRLSALEYFVCKIHASMVLGQTGSLDAAEVAIRKSGEEASKHLPPGVPDRAPSKWVDAIQALTDMQIKFLEEMRS